MMTVLRILDLITSADDAVRNTSVARHCAGRTSDWLLGQCQELDAFRRTSENLYQRVRALFFLSAIHRYELPRVLPPTDASLIPFEGFNHLLRRRFNEAID